MKKRENDEFFNWFYRASPEGIPDDEKFWPIIDLFDWTRIGEDEKVLQPALQELTKREVSDIELFQEVLAHKLYQLDTKEHAKNIGKHSYDEKEQYVSADGFLYARCAAVAGGKEVYERALSHPAKMPKDIEFEYLLYLPMLAYELKTGEEWKYSTKVSFETYTNIEGWQ